MIIAVGYLSEPIPSNGFNSTSSLFNVGSLPAAFCSITRPLFSAQTVTPAMILRDDSLLPETVTMRDILHSIRDQHLHEWGSWRARLVVWGAAVVAGLRIVGFSEATGRGSRFFFHYATLYPWLPLLSLPLGGMVVAACTRMLAPGAEGSGIPQVAAALETSSIALRNRLLSLRVVVGRIALGTLALGSGFSTGREGPCVQIGASIMYNARRWLPTGYAIPSSQLIVAGGAAGIAAAFHTPLAGIVFAIEELSRSFEQHTSSVVLTVIVIAGLTAISLMGNHTYFGRIATPVIDSRIVLPVIFCGLFCGLTGGFFSRLLSVSGRPWRGHLGRFRQQHPLYFAGLCGLLVALIGISTHDGGSTHNMVYGSGYQQTQAVLEQGANPHWYYPFAKIAATAFSFFSGIPGGLFAPTLAIGAGLGHDIAPLFHEVAATAVMALCMTAFLAALTQAPITSFIIVMEMVDGHAMVISLIAVALIARLVSGLISPPLYPTLAQNLLTWAPETRVTPPDAPPPAPELST
jgi:H+/Cl- antiporter ClcA